MVELGGIGNGGFPKACCSNNFCSNSYPQTGQESIFGGNGINNGNGFPNMNMGGQADGNQAMSQILNILQMLLGVMGSLINGMGGSQAGQNPLSQTGGTIPQTTQDPLGGTSGLGSGSTPNTGSGLDNISGLGTGSGSAINPGGTSGSGMAQNAGTGTPTQGSASADAKLKQASEIIKQKGDPQMIQALQDSNISFTNFSGNQIGLGGYKGNSKFVKLDQPFVESQSPERVAVLLVHELTHTMGGDENAAESVEQQWDNKLGLPYDRD